jgi:pimeloyl-ACP methyl ester carboxylesterase
MKAEVMGTSLGGALSLHTASYLPQYLQAAYAFNSPGMSSVECRAWKQKTKEEKPRVEVYLQKGDPVSEFVGSKFSSDWAVYQVYAEDQDPFQSHASMFLAYPESFVIPLDAQKVNEHRVMWAWVQNILFIPLFLLNLLLWPFVWLCHFFIEKGFSQSLPEKS